MIFKLSLLLNYILFAGYLVVWAFYKNGNRLVNPYELYIAESGLDFFIIVQVVTLIMLIIVQRVKLKGILLFLISAIIIDVLVFMTIGIFNKL